MGSQRRRTPRQGGNREPGFGLGVVGCVERAAKARRTIAEQVLHLLA